jgi:hypothetical protein
LAAFANKDPTILFDKNFSKLVVETGSYKSHTPRDGTWSNKLESASQPLHLPTNLNNKENKSVPRVEGASIGEIVVNDGGLDGSSEAALDGSNVSV